MFQIARNEVLRAAKKAGQRVKPVDECVPADGDAHSEYDDAEVVASALGRLSAEDRELIELKVFGGLTFQEVAGVLRLPPGTVATRYRRTLESLRPWLLKQVR